jgi:hypothetical protein
MNVIHDHPFLEPKSYITAEMSGLLSEKLQKEFSNGISCHDSQVMGGAGEPRAEQKNQAGKTIGRWTADDGDQRLLQINGKHAQGGHSRPADEVTESHQDQSGNQPWRQTFPEFREIRRMLKDSPNGFRFGKDSCDFSNHMDGSFLKEQDDFIVKNNINDKELQSCIFVKIAYL